MKSEEKHAPWMYWRFEAEKVRDPDRVVVYVNVGDNDMTHRGVTHEKLFEMVDDRRDEHDEWVPLEVSEVRDAVGDWLCENHFDEQLIDFYESRRVEVVAEVRMSLDLSWFRTEDERGVHSSMSPYFVLHEGLDAVSEGYMGIDPRMYPEMMERTDGHED